MNIKHLDGWLYVGVAVSAAVTASLTSDDAKQFMSAGHLFALKSFTSAVGAGLLAGKMYRSTSFANTKAQDAADAAADLPEKLPAAPPAEKPAETPPVAK